MNKQNTILSIYGNYKKVEVFDGYDILNKFEITDAVAGTEINQSAITNNTNPMQDKNISKI